jgi:hypothetical protein
MNAIEKMYPNLSAAELSTIILKGKDFFGISYFIIKMLKNARKNYDY